VQDFRLPKNHVAAAHPWMWRIEMNRKPFTILVSIPLKLGRANEFLALLNDVFDAMKVEETFVNATALRSADDPDTIMLVETWLDRYNFMSEQLKRPYREEYETRLPELLRAPRMLSFYEPIRSVP
jgi:quinol monooxygenase YgiN